MFCVSFNILIVVFCFYQFCTYLRCGLNINHNFQIVNKIGLTSSFNGWRVQLLNTMTTYFSRRIKRTNYASLFLLYNDFVPRQRHEQCSLGGLIQTCFIILSMGISYLDVCVTILSSVECFGISKKLYCSTLIRLSRLLRYPIKVICMKCYYWKLYFAYKSISQL